MTEHLVLVSVAVVGTIVECAMLLVAIMQMRAARREQAEAMRRLDAVASGVLAALRGQRSS